MITCLIQNSKFIIHNYDYWKGEILGLRNTYAWQTTPILDKY